MKLFESVVQRIAMEFVVVEVDGPQTLRSRVFDINVTSNN